MVTESSGPPGGNKRSFLLFFVFLAVLYALKALGYCMIEIIGPVGSVEVVLHGVIQSPFARVSR